MSQNPNQDLETAYEMGLRVAFVLLGISSAPGFRVKLDAHVESQDYADQRRSDLKELVSFDRSWEPRHEY